MDDGIAGTLGAMVTPLGDHGHRVDEDAFGPLLEFYAASDLDGLFVLGSTGEAILLAADERRRAAELALAGPRDLRVIVNCGAQNTADTVALAAHAAEAGADGVAVVGPPYYPFSGAELLEHFAAAAAACAPVPFYVYEYADRTGYAVPVAVLGELRERAPNLTGMKVSDAPFDRVRPYFETGLDIFIGSEPVLPQGLEHGAVGAVSGVAGAFPNEVAALVREPTAARLALVESLRAVLSAQPFQASVKAALRLRGVPVQGDVRAPLRPLAPEVIEWLRAELEGLLGAELLARPVRA
jgi:dihydrodipicolinate synthase/N-acetylneuraminate lyase